MEDPARERIYQRLFDVLIGTDRSAPFHFADGGRAAGDPGDFAGYET